VKNRNVGFLIIGVTALIGFIVAMFNTALTEIVATSCSHGSSCPMWGTIQTQTNIGLGVMIFMLLVGLYLVFFGDRPADGKVATPNYAALMKKMKVDERVIFRPLVEAEGAIFQSELVEKTGFSKVKVSRILDRLEGKGMVERRRHGMSNMVIVKNGGQKS
jgi:hypothetical protein